MPNRFGNNGTFLYKPGDTVGTTGGTYLYLFEDEMPQYPFEDFTETDRKTHTSRTGKMWAYENYRLNGYTFNWANCSQDLRDRLRRMYDSNAAITFNTRGSTWGTFRMMDDSWQSSEVGYDLFDLNFSLLESV